MFHFIVADLRRHRLGVLIVLLLVALATALGVAVTLQERALRLGSARAAAPFDVIVGAPGSETQLVLSSVFLQAAPLPLIPVEVLTALRADPRVVTAVPVGFGDFIDGYPIVGTTPDAIEMLGGLATGDGFHHYGDAIVGADVKRRLGSKFQPLHGTAEEGGTEHAHAEYHIVGRLKRTGTPWDRAVLVPIQAVWDVHAEPAFGNGQEPAHKPAPVEADDHDHEHEQGHEHGHEHEHEHEHGHDHENEFAARPLDPAALTDPDSPGVPAIIVKAKRIADAYSLRQQYRGGETLAVFPGEVLTRLYGTLGDARRILSAVAAGAQALVAAAILMVIAVHVLQRRRQIGALRAFGAPRLTVLSIVWLEVFTVLTAGLLLGFGLGYAAVRLMSQHLSRTSGVPMPVTFQASDLWMLAGFVLIAALATVVPALIAYRQTPAQALRA